MTSFPLGLSGDFSSLDDLLNEERLVYLQLLTSLYRHLNAMWDLLAHLRSHPQLVNFDYSEMTIRYLLFELHALQGERSPSRKKGGLAPLKSPSRQMGGLGGTQSPLLEAFPHVQAHWRQLWGSRIAVPFSQFMREFVPTFWGTQTKLQQMLQWSLDLPRDGLVTTYRLSCFLTQFDGPQHQVDQPGSSLAELIDQLPTGFLAHVNHCHAYELLANHLRFLPQTNRPVVVWRFSRSYPTVLSFDVYFPQRRQILSYRHQTNQSTIVDMIHQMAPECLFLQLELQEDYHPHQMEVSYHIHSLYREDAVPLGV